MEPQVKKKKLLGTNPCHCFAIFKIHPNLVLCSQVLATKLIWNWNQNQLDWPIVTATAHVRNFYFLCYSLRTKGGEK